MEYLPFHLGYIEINELKEAFKGTLAESDVAKIAEAADIKGDEVLPLFIKKFRLIGGLTTGDIHRRTYDGVS